MDLRFKYGLWLNSKDHIMALKVYIQKGKSLKKIQTLPNHVSLLGFKSNSKVELLSKLLNSSLSSTNNVGVVVFL